MRRTLGACTASCVLAIAGFAAVGVAGFSTMSSLGIGSCLLSCDGDKTAANEKTTTTVANKEKAEGKACCDLAKLAKGEANVQAASAKEGGDCSKTCDGSKVQNVAAKEGQCAGQCPVEALKVAEASYKTACESGCDETKSAAKVALIQAKLVEAEYQMTKAEKAGCCQSKAAAEAKLTAVRAEAKEAGVCSKTCSKEATVQTVAAKEAGECSKTCSKEGAVTTVAAKEAGECSKPCSAEGVKVAEAAYKAACEKGCEESMKTAKVALIQAKLVEAQDEVAKAEGGCCKTKAAAEAKLTAVRAEAKEAGLCCKTGAVKVENAANAEKSGCCSKAGKAEANAARTTDAVVGGKTPVVIPAAFAPKACCAEGKKVEAAAAKSDEGCCKGTGVRADGKPCCGKCDTTKEAEAPAAGEPVASR